MTWWTDTNPPSSPLPPSGSSRFKNPGRFFFFFLLFPEKSLFQSQRTGRPTGRCFLSFFHEKWEGKEQFFFFLSLFFPFVKYSPYNYVSNRGPRPRRSRRKRSPFFFPSPSLLHPFPSSRDKVLFRSSPLSPPFASFSMGGRSGGCFPAPRPRKFFSFF